MLVKGSTISEHVKNLTEVLGIEANPEKIRAILDMPHPKMVNDMQRLTGRVVVLNILVTSFSWTEEFQVAFEKLKSYLTSLPLLMSPRVGETLYLYLTTSEETVVAILVRAKDVYQFPVYYVSKVLQNAHKLCPYFQNHPVVVMTNQPIKDILSKANTLGRMTKWSIELAKFDVEYVPRTTIKLQILADFIVQCSFEKPISLIISSPQEDTGSGAGVLLVYPSKNEWQYRLSFGFQISNNTTKYEALMSRLQLAHQFGVRDLIVHTDSQLVAKQIINEYEVNESVLKKYHSIAAQFLVGFDRIQVKQLSKKDNMYADALSNLASLVVIEQRGKFLLEYRDTPSYNIPQIFSLDQNERWITAIIRMLQGKESHIEKKKVYPSRRCTVRKGYSHPLFQCLATSEAEYMMREIHDGIYGDHLGGRLLA
ncbi:rve domain-containing protein/RVT_3 domain-containing protein [Gossypium australe]|uniref:Rve domain-containing protein/RVT_3 domain-containing protein n=1 Tax=Gossypium australe TaxID=47621 RepID=A0A5B6UFJ8_9ROSI|nr:rve domain-containing protein/RVT_3 domain-containing protein [Gossypium australe]